MLKIKRGLTNILENNNEPEEAAPLPPQPQTPQHVQLQTVQTPQPPAASRHSEADWGELLIRLLASAPDDVAQKLVTCIDREVLLKVLERRNDPYLKVALLMLTLTKK